MGKRRGFTLAGYNDRPKPCPEALCEGMVRPTRNANLGTCDGCHKRFAWSDLDPIRVRVWEADAAWLSNALDEGLRLFERLGDQQSVWRIHKAIHALDQPAVRGKVFLHLAVYDSTLKAMEEATRWARGTHLAGSIHLKYAHLNRQFKAILRYRERIAA